MMQILHSVDELLEHIKTVQEDVIKLSHDSLMNITRYIENNKLSADEDIATALQYQDIITQQLSATIEAIESMRSSIDIFSHAYKSDEDLATKSIAKLQEKLNITLQEAKEKKERFSGRTDAGADDEIEFF